MTNPKLLLAVLALLAGVVTTNASTATNVGRIVYVKGGNVWTANADGSGSRRITRDGTSASPYRTPTIANTGLIVAARGSGSRARLYRFSSDGRFLGAIETDSLLSGPLDPKVSPDGKLIAYWSVHVLRPCLWCYLLRYPFQHHYTYSNRFTPAGVFGKEMSQRAPTWVGNTRTIAFYGVNAFYDDLGRGANSAQQWFTDADVEADPMQWRQYIEGEMTVAGDKLAVLRRLEGTRDVITLFRANGGPPAKPTAVCRLNGGPRNTASGQLDNPAWSPDGRFLTFADPSGIWVATVPELQDGACGTIRARLAVPGGTQPDW